MAHLYNGILLSHRKNKILSFVTTGVDLEGIMLSEINQTEKDKYHIISLICGIIKTKQTNKTESNSHTQRTHWGLPKGKRVGGCVKKVKGLRSANWYLQNSHRDVKCSTGNISIIL